MTFHELDRVSHYLSLWAGWVRRWRPKLGYPGHSPGVVSGGSVQSFDDLSEQADDYAARTVDGILRSLPPAEMCAVEVHYLNAVWRFPRNNLDELYERARERVEEGLQQWGLP